MELSISYGLLVNVYQGKGRNMFHALSVETAI